MPPPHKLAFIATATHQVGQPDYGLTVVDETRRPKTSNFGLTRRAKNSAPAYSRDVVAHGLRASTSAAIVYYDNETDLQRFTDLINSEGIDPLWVRAINLCHYATGWTAGRYLRHVSPLAAPNTIRKATQFNEPVFGDAGQISRVLYKWWLHMRAGVKGHQQK